MKTLFKFSLPSVAFLAKAGIALFAFLFFAGAISTATGADPVKTMEVIAIISGLSVVARLVVLIAKPFAAYNKVTGLALAISHELWEDFIASNLYKGYGWLMRAKDRSSKVLNNAVVHIQNAGQFVEVKLNRNVFPVNLTHRADSDLTYAIDTLSSNAVRITDADKKELAPGFVEDNIGDITNELGKRSAQLSIYRWLGKNASGSNLAQANVVRTTGADATAHVNSTATGNRKKLLAADIATGKVVLINGTKKERGNWVAIMDETMYNQLKSDSTVTDKDTMDSVGAVWKDGDLVRIHGFEIIRTDVMPAFTESTPSAKNIALDPDTFAAAATDNAVVGLIDLDLVHIAKGTINFYETIKDAMTQSDNYSADNRLGASRERADDAGVVAVVQAAGS